MATTSAGKLRLSANPTTYSLEVLHPRKKKTYNRVPSSMRQNLSLNHPDLSKGQKRYLWSICSIYSTAQMKQLIQDQFINQLFYEMSKGIVRSADWHKYLEYIADPRKRKQQFQAKPKHWKAPKDQYKFRYYRDHPVDLQKPCIPPLVQEIINDQTRPPKPPPLLPMRYKTRRRREGSLPDFPRGIDSQRDTQESPRLPPRPVTAMGSSSSKESNYSYSSSFTGDSSANTASDVSSEAEKPEKPVREGFTRPKSRIGSRQRQLIVLDD